MPEIRYNNVMEPILSYRDVGKVCQEAPIQEAPVKENEDRILVIRNMGLGDVVMSLVAVKALRRKHPLAKIRFACNREFVEMVECTPFIDEALPLNQEMKRINGEMVFDLRMCVEPHEISGKISKELYDRKNRIDIFLDTVGMTGASQTPGLYLKSADIVWAKKFVDNLNIKDRRLVGIQPVCTSLYRSWPEGYFREFIDKIDHDKYIIVVLGEKCPWSWASYEAEGDGIVNLLGKTTVGQACAIVGQLDVMIGIDSGFIHVAGALGKNGIGLFGAIDPDLRLRYYPTVTTVTPAKNPMCAPCGDVGMGGPDCPPVREVDKFRQARRVGGPCMWEIKPDNVMAALTSTALDQKRCLLCNGSTSILGAKQGYLFYRCRLCGFVFSDRWVEKDVQRVYSTAEYWGNKFHRARDIDVNHRTRMRRILQFGDIGGKKLLDVGCGQGQFVRYLRKNSVDAKGIDYVVKHKEPFFNVRSVFDETRQFDVVSCIELIEHVYDPNGLFEAFRRIIRPRGILYIETSDTDRAMAWKNLKLGNEWFDPPIHCVSFDIRSLQVALELHGFEMIDHISKDLKDFSLVVMARRKV